MSATRVSMTFFIVSGLPSTPPYSIRLPGNSTASASWVWETVTTT